jgi:hypothetical protein
MVGWRPPSGVGLCVKSRGRIVPPPQLLCFLFLASSPHNQCSILVPESRAIPQHRATSLGTRSFSQYTPFGICCNPVNCLGALSSTVTWYMHQKRRPPANVPTASHISSFVACFWPRQCRDIGTQFLQKLQNSAFSYIPCLSLLLATSAAARVITSLFADIPARLPWELIVRS